MKNRGLREVTVSEPKETIQPTTKLLKAIAIIVEVLVLAEVAPA
jgi:hypothetical protein